MAEQTKTPQRSRLARKPEKPPPTAEAQAPASQAASRQRPPSRDLPPDPVGPMGGNGQGLRQLQRAAGNQAMSQLMAQQADRPTAAPPTTTGQAPDDTVQAPAATRATSPTPGSQSDHVETPPGASGQVPERAPTSPVAQAQAVDEALRKHDQATRSRQPEYAQSVTIETRPGGAEQQQDAAAAEGRDPAIAQRETPTPQATGEQKPATEEATPPVQADRPAEAEQQEQDQVAEQESDAAIAQMETQAAQAEEEQKPATEEAAAEEDAEKEKEEAPAEDEAAEEAASGEAGGEDQTSEATAKVNESVNGLAQAQAETAGLAFKQVNFAPRPEEKVKEPRTAFRAAQQRAASETVAAAFLARNVNHVQNIISLGMTAPPRITAVADEAKVMLDAAVANNIGLVRGKIGAMRERAQADAAKAIENISAGREQALESVQMASAEALATVGKAHIDTKTTLDTLEAGQLRSIEALYQTWVPKYRAVGGEVGDMGLAIARTMGAKWLSQRNGKSTIMSGPVHDNRLEARADAAKKVAKEYKKGLQEEANKQADKLAANKPKVQEAIRKAAKQGRDALDQHLEAMTKALKQSEESATDQIQTKADSLIEATQASLQTTMASLDAQEAAQVARLIAYGASQKAAIDDQAAEAIAALVTGTTEAVTGFNTALLGFVETALATQAPDQKDLQPVLGELQVQADDLALQLQLKLETGIAASEAGLRSGGQISVARVNELGQGAVAQAQATGDHYSKSTSTMVAQAQSGFTKLAKGHQKTVGEASKRATEGFTKTKEAIKAVFKTIDDRSKENFKNGRVQLKKGLEKAGLKKLKPDIKKYAQKAADAVKPRWKKVVKWVITIAVVIAAVALTIVTAGSAGPIGVILIGAAVGGLAGATIQVGHNLVDGKKWSAGVGKAFVVGAIGGAFGGLGGVLAQGVANVGLKLAVEVGVDVVGGVLGDLAVGNPITIEGILFGAAIGAGIGGGLALGSALKGKIKIKTAVDAPTTKVDVGGPALPKAGADTAPPKAIADKPTPKAIADKPTPKAAADKPAPKAIADKPTPKAAESPKPKAPEATPPPKSAGPEPKPSAKQKGHPDKPEVEDGIVAKQKTADGHEIKVTKDGRVVKCSECEIIELKYAKEIAADEGFKKRLKAIKKNSDPDVKAKQAAELEVDLKQRRAELEAKADVAAKPGQSNGPDLAKAKGYPEAEPGYHWASVNETPVYRRNPGNAGPKRTYDPSTGQFKNKGATSIETRSYNDSGKVDPCFPPGTIVKTPNGDARIEELKSGQLVLAYDLDTGDLIEAPILRVYKNWTRNLVEVQLDSVTVSSTSQHRFWVGDIGEWVPAIKLATEMDLRLISGESSPIIATRAYESKSTTYNLEVSQAHNYFVGRPGILVHNGIDDSGFNTTDRRWTKIYEIHDIRKPGTPIYVGKSLQGGPGEVFARLRGHLGSKAEWKKIEKFIRPKVVAEGNWTTFETAAWEQHTMDKYGGPKSANPNTPLENKIRAISEAKYNEFRKPEYGHNPCP